MKHRTWLRIGLIVLAVLAAPSLARAQASITGVVTDESGGALPGVTVEASSPALIEKVRSVSTDGEGLYRLVDLRPGMYTVTFTLPGFATLVRDQITLAGTATVSVNGQLKVGTLEETLTVTGEAPMVDTTSAAREQVVDRELLDALPTGRQMWTVAVTLPGVTLNGQDVGGAGGLQQTRMRAFGAVEQEVTIEVDGILMNSVHGGGSTQQYFNDGMVQEMSVATGALDAETQTGGVRLNMIPQTGGNVYSGSVVFVSVPNSSFQSSNLDDGLRNATCGPTNTPCGLTSVNGVDKIGDFNASAGGPLKRDKLWFFASSRTLIGDTTWPNVPYLEGNRIYEQSVRLTSQLNAMNKVTGLYERNKKTKSAQSPGIGTDLDAANQRTGQQPYEVAQLKWTGTVSPRLLLEGGWGLSAIRFDLAYQDGIAAQRGTPEWFSRVARRDLGLNTLKVAGVPYTNNINHRNTFHGTATYVTGSHAFKFGGQQSSGPLQTISDSNGDLVQQYRNGRPESVVVYNTPYDTTANTDADGGVFAQDTWRRGNVTMNLGVRYDFFSSSIPEQRAPAGRFVPERSFAKIVSPTFQDISPRLNMSWDPYGDGKTALKAGFSKFVNRMTAGTLVNPYNPLASTTDTRTWTDLNGDDVAQDSEIGPRNSAAVGTSTTRTFDPDLVPPFNRFYNVSAERQIVEGFQMGVGFYRRTFHDLIGSDNTLVSPADYTSRTVANPMGGSALTIYNLDPAKRTAQLIVDINDPNQEYVYNGMDVNFQARIAGGRLLGGVTTEKWVIDNCSMDDPNNPIPGGSYPGTTGGQYCKQRDFDVPFRTQAKLSGFYPLPVFGLEVSGVFMSFPGERAFTNYTVTPAISPGLTQASITVPLVGPGDKFYDQRFQTDLGLAKSIRFGASRRLRLQFDAFNLFNANTVMSRFATYGPRLDQPQEVLVGRLMRVGAQFHF